ncbi:MAG TPA: 30S ribosomal protein S12 methylthiotransferase RimO [Rectinemataceae bacterium]|nr:30S ribosomal protein S12 methylthiotransferase RimO [Rectinemataceae bacterium]
MKFYLDEHGCSKNQVDAEEIIVRLEDAGHEEVRSAEGADLVIVNSCGFIDSAKKESIDAVMGWKTAWPGKKVLLAGCLAQRYAKELAEELAEADGIVGNADLGAVTLAVAELAAGLRPVIVPEAAASIGTVRRRRLLDWPGCAHVKITEGCSNNCTFCAIPLIRGRLRSRPLSDIVSEIAELLSPSREASPSGGGAPIREIVLVGQDLGSYGKDLGPDVATVRGPEAADARRLPALLEAISALEGDFRLRVMYIHPDNFPRAILPIMARDPRILPYFDIPFQHASPSLLRKMNRRGGAEAYLELIAEIRAALPDAMLRSTFLLGFPGEGEEDYAILRDFQEKARFDWLGSFAYSREDGTAAATMKGRVPKRTVEERRRGIEEAQERITSERLRRFVGRELEILVEEPIEEDPEGGRVGAGGGVADEGSGVSASIGRAWLQAPEVDGLTVLRGAFAPGSLVLARVLGLAGVDLDAEPIRLLSGTKEGGPGRARAT